MIIDSFYVFEKPILAEKFPSRIPVSAFDKVDVLGELVLPKEQDLFSPLVELSSEKSGLKLSFTSNRTSARAQPLSSQPHVSQNLACNSIPATSSPRTSRVRRFTEAQVKLRKVMAMVRDVSSAVTVINQ